MCSMGLEVLLCYGLWHLVMVVRTLSNYIGVWFLWNGTGKENFVYSWDASTTFIISLGLLNVFQFLVMLRLKYWYRGGYSISIPSELWEIHKHYNRHEGELVTWLLLWCWDNGTHGLDLGAKEVKQLGLMAREAGIDRGLHKRHILSLFLSDSCSVRKQVSL